jgi:hypothetical protein
MRVRASVDVDLRAFHTDPHMHEGRHEHVWNVRLVYDGEPFRDARCFRAALTQFLAPYQGNDLPEEWWAAEELAKAVLCIGTGDPIGCIVSRDGFSADVWKMPRQGPIAYLCGPINGCTDAEANDWRSLFKSLWIGRTRDPMRRDYRGREAECVREIVELDKIDVAGSDVLIVNYDKPSVGTSMEVLYAWERGKPVVTVCATDANVSPWLRYHSTELVHSFREAVAVARKLTE